MYISTCIRNKNIHQHSYGFQNFMSSWGSWSKISKLQQVGDVSLFRSKSSLFFSPPLGRPFLRKNTDFLFFCVKDFTKDFTDDFVGRLFFKDFTKDFTNDFVGRLFYQGFYQGFY